MLPLLPLIVMGEEGWIEKSATWNVTPEVVWVRLPLVPVTVTV